jgi:hypothetical protein
LPGLLLSSSVWKVLHISETNVYHFDHDEVSLTLLTFLVSSSRLSKTFLNSAIVVAGWSLRKSMANRLLCVFQGPETAPSKKKTNRVVKVFPGSIGFPFFVGLLVG